MYICRCSLGMVWRFCVVFFVPVGSRVPSLATLLPGYDSIAEAMLGWGVVLCCLVSGHVAARVVKEEASRNAP